MSQRATTIFNSTRQWLRILTFLHSFEPGGVERIALRLIRQWRDRGIDAPLFMGRPTGAMRDELAQDLVYGLPRPSRVPIAWCETLWMIVTLPRFIGRTKPDVLFCAGNSYTIVAVAMKLILGRACPPILAKISNDLDRKDIIWPARMAYRLWLRIQGRFIDGFVGMEQPMAAEIAAAIRPRRGGIAIIPDPALSHSQIDNMRAALRPTAERSRDVRFVAVGRLAPQKNFALMLRAFAAAAQLGDTLVIYGDGPERGKLSTLIDRLKMRDYITLAGHVPDPARHLPDFDVFLLSSDYEGVPAVLLEALAANRPIITTQCSCSIRAMMGEGTLAHIVPAGDEAAFTRAIGSARDLKQDMAASLRQARRFTVEDAAGAYLAAFGATQKNSKPRLREDRECVVSAPTP
ncbi:glycosyltransferase [Sphingobium sp. AN558]|uniref:glycosyltransferase n=1 Tax=Sphingobium sp. AN558 TaxID=3133442 RepID=UPI0030BF8E05